MSKPEKKIITRAGAGIDEVLSMLDTYSDAISSKKTDLGLRVGILMANHAMVEAADIIRQLAGKKPRKVH